MFQGESYVYDALIGPPGKLSQVRDNGKVSQPAYACESQIRHREACVLSAAVCRLCKRVSIAQLRHMQLLQLTGSVITGRLQRLLF